MTKDKRLEVYNKYSGHCAYCGKSIKYEDMQIDHINPKRNGGADDIENLNPSCRTCNHYKRASSLGGFRIIIRTLHKRIQQNYICRVAENYGIIEVKPWDGKFYFERVSE